MPENIYHIPALLSETICGLAIKSNGIYVDVTFGGGGHSREILKQLGPKGKLLSFDQDFDAYLNATNNPDFNTNDTRWQFIHANFRYLKNFLHYYNAIPIDGILADLGVSFHHFDTSERGFSFRLQGPLDMRMNQRSDLTAAEIVNNYTEEQLSDLFYLYGELHQARQIAKTIVKQRNTAAILTTQQLVAILSPFCQRDKEKKDLARVFQALRIEVNDEMAALKQMLNATISILNTNGRIAILTYHSLEDRIVKNFLKTGNIEGKLQKDFYGKPITPFKLINNKVITASEEEIIRNPRARSAKLRIAEKI